MFAVIVTLKVDPARLEEFMPLMHANAQASLEGEPGCLRFDVCTDATRPGDVFLYELYTEDAAFTAHLRTAHFITFDTAVADMVIHKDVRTYEDVRS